MFSILGSLGSSIVDGISDHFKGKQELAKVKLEAKKVEVQAEAESKLAQAKSQMKLAEMGKAGDIELDKIAMKQMENSWKDEFLMLIFYTPVILAFVPGMQEYAVRGFEVISTMPEWYQYSVIAILIVTFGLRSLVKDFISSKGFPKLGK